MTGRACARYLALVSGVGGVAVDPHVGLSDADFDLLTLFEDGRQQEAHFGGGGNGEDYEEGGELGWMMSAGLCRSKRCHKCG